MVWAVAVGDAARARSMTDASVASKSAGAHTQLTRPIAPRLGRAHVVVQERQLLGAAEPDDARQPQHRAVGDEAVARRAQAEDGVGGGQAEIARERELQPPPIE